MPEVLEALRLQISREPDLRCVQERGGAPADHHGLRREPVEELLEVDRQAEKVEMMDDCLFCEWNDRCPFGFDPTRYLEGSDLDESDGDGSDPFEGTKMSEWRKEEGKLVKEVSAAEVMGGKQPYIVIEASSINSLEKCVAGCLYEGYVPLGGVQVVVRDPAGQLGSGVIYFQAMVYNEAP